MNKFNHFIGIDISKKVFDATILLESNETMHSEFQNSKEGIKEFVKWTKSLGAKAQTTLVCMEHTGIYKNIIVKQLFAKKYNVWVEMPLCIIKSSGIQKGKNDKIDSERIAQYAKRFEDKATLYKGNNIVLDKIQALLKQREMFMTQKKAILTRAQEQMSYDQESYTILKKRDQRTIDLLNENITDIELELNTLREQDQEINQIYKCITSVKGVGTITSLSLIYYTKMFTTFNSPRELASYCGVVPFEHTSGKSIKGRPKVHYIVNKTLKSLLHLCAVSAIQCDPELKAFYEKKIAEGKHKMSVINSVRNKLVHRICACVRDRKLYQVKQVA